MHPIELFTTPKSREALDAYIDLFNGDDAKAANLGYNHWYTILTSQDLEKYWVSNLVEGASRVVALTVAGMTWNLTCKEAEEDIAAKQQEDRWNILKAKLQDEADVTK